MAKIEFKGLEEYIAKLNRLEALSRDKVIGAAVYDGAQIVADAVRASIQALPTDEGHYQEQKKSVLLRRSKTFCSRGWVWPLCKMTMGLKM